MKRWFTGLASCTAWHAVLIVIAIMLPSTASLAQGTRAQRMACAGDVWRLCSAAIPSVDRIVACLKREKARLSPGCQAVFNDPKVQAAINGSPAAAPGKATSRAQPEQAASTAAAPVAGGTAGAAAERGSVTRSLSAAPPKATSHAEPEQAASTAAAPVPGGTGSAAAERPSDDVTRPPPAAPPEDVASAASPAQSGAGWKIAAPIERVASRDVEPTSRVNSNHGRQQREAYHQSGHSGRSGNRYGGMMAQIAPLIAMAMGGSQGGGGNFDVGQMMGMARNMGFDPGTLMGGGGNWR